MLEAPVKGNIMANQFVSKVLAATGHFQLVRSPRKFSNNFGQVLKCCIYCM